MNDTLLTPPVMNDTYLRRLSGPACLHQLLFRRPKCIPTVEENLGSSRGPVPFSNLLKTTWEAILMTGYCASQNLDSVL